MEILNSREWAILVWAAILAGYLARRMSWATLQQHIVRLFQSLLTRPLVSVLSFMTIFVVIIIYWLWSMGIWKPALLKTTIYWYFAVAVVTFFRLNEYSVSPSRIRTLVAENFKLIVVLEYLIGAFTFHFLIELLIVPLMAYLSWGIASSEGVSGLQPLNRILNTLLTIVSIAILGSVMFRLFTDYHQVFKQGAALELILPAVMTILYVPFIVLFVIYSTYQRVNARLQCAIDNLPLYNYARALAILSFNIRVGLLDRWSHNVAKGTLVSRSDVRRSIRNTFQMIALERHPIACGEVDGWDPRLAKDYLLSEGLETGDYNPDEILEPKEWWCASPLVEIDGGVIPNNLAYYLTGKQWVVNSLKLKLNVNNPRNSSHAHQRLLKAAIVLLRHATGEALEELGATVCAGTNRAWKVGTFNVAVAKTKWRNSGYDLSFEITPDS